MKNEEKKIKIVYAEPADYFPKEIREKYKLGEFAESENAEEGKSIDDTKMADFIDKNWAEYQKGHETPPTQSKEIEIVDIESADYFSVETRKKFKLGEFAEPEQEDTEEKEEYLVNCGGIQPIDPVKNDNKETEKELNWENYEDMLKRKEAKKK